MKHINDITLGEIKSICTEHLKEFKGLFNSKHCEGCSLEFICDEIEDSIPKDWDFKKEKKYEIL